MYNNDPPPPSPPPILTRGPSQQCLLLFFQRADGVHVALLIDPQRWIFFFFRWKMKRNRRGSRLTREDGCQPASRPRYNTANRRLTFKSRNATSRSGLLCRYVSPLPTV